MPTWNEGWPDWQDAGKLVEIECEGRILRGRLFVADMMALESGDEVPVFSLRTDDGDEIGFADHDHWRFA